MKRMIITGATSMIGVALIKEALENDIEVFALVRSRTKRRKRLPQDGRIHIIEADLADLADLECPLTNGDVFYHFAWEGTAKKDRNDPFIQMRNITYTMDAVELAYRCGCATFIGAGSQAEYGRVNGIIKNETRFAAETAYGAAKYAAGKLSRTRCDELGMMHVWGRVFSVYGCYDNDGTMIDYAIRQFLQGEKAKFSVGTQLWDYLNEQDAGKIFFLLGMQLKKSAEYRIASGISRPLQEFINEIAKAMQAEKLCEFEETFVNMPVNLEADISDLKRDIGYEPAVPFSEGIREVISYYKMER